MQLSYNISENFWAMIIDKLIIPGRHYAGGHINGNTVPTVPKKESFHKLNSLSLRNRGVVIKATPRARSTYKLSGKWLYL